MKIFFRNIHLYLSLAAGSVIMIACLTGAVLVFEKELQELFNSERYFVKPEGERLSADLLVKNLQSAHPGYQVSSLKMYSDTTRTVEIGYLEKEPHVKSALTSAASFSKEGSGKKVQAEGSKPSEGAKKSAFVNPYTGQIVELYSYRETFFYKVFALHRWLLGKNDGIGKYIVGVSTFIFLFILLTGVILWWPKTRKVLAQRIRVKWDGSWKRLNHDLHIVLGFYTAIFLFIFAFTGLAWSFQWFNKAIYKVTRSEMKPPADPPSSLYMEQKRSLGFERILKVSSQQITDALYYTISSPKDSVGVYAVTVLTKQAMEMASDTYYLDQYTGQTIGVLKFTDKNLGQRVRSTFKPVHTGSVFGVYSKLLAFITCLLGVTFPITGTIMWISRLKKKNRKERQPGTITSTQLA
jgi:uncharacterized iron-regulated membrane protein